jgi:hypothetical protein
VICYESEKLKKHEKIVDPNEDSVVGTNAYKEGLGRVPTKWACDLL